MNARILPLVAAALLSLSACGSSADSSSAGAADTTPNSADAPDPTIEASTGSATSTGDSATVTIMQSRFDNVELRVAAGTTVTFVNADAFAHTVTSRDGAPVEFDSGNLGQDESFEFTFDQPGEYAYFCQIHPTMRAVVIVE